MRSIALVELQEHQEVLFGLIDLLRMQSVEIKVFAPAYMLEPWPVDWMTDSKLKRYPKFPKESIPVFITRHKREVDTCEVLIFTTLVSNFAFFAQQRFLPKTILLIHKGNFFFARSKSLQIRSFKDGLRWIRSVWLREGYFQRKMLHNFYGCAFLDPLITEFMQPYLPAKLSTIDLPSVYYSSVSPPLNVTIQIVVPGTVSALTRDFNMLFAALKLVDGKLKQPIELIFLGNAGTSRARGLFQLMGQRTFKQVHIQTFENSIDEATYTAQLQLADFLILPLKASIQFGIYQEWYGKTTISGGINDLLRFGKPTLLPNFYPLHPALNQLTQRYQNADELAQLLLEWVNEQAYLPIAERASTELEPFSKENTSKRLMEILKRLL
ncbi:hypothetical protein [Haliscomenobacter sp.]|uniref:hypothetical protein n=1 Tax=Haliscomenobacter sp. TaxID=2717303 RepID=UPI003364C650